MNFQLVIDYVGSQLCYTCNTCAVFLLAPEKFGTFSKFYHFHNNNDNYFPYISI